jgi:hypothetical protein
MKTMGVISSLGLSLTNGECLEIAKRERHILESHIKQMKCDTDTKLFDITEKIHKHQALDVLIGRFEIYLGHKEE